MKDYGRNFVGPMILENTAYGPWIDSRSYDGLDNAISNNQGLNKTIFVAEDSQLNTTYGSDFSGITLWIPKGITLTISYFGSYDLSFYIEDGGQVKTGVTTTINGNIESKGYKSGVVAFDVVSSSKYLTLNGSINAGRWKIFGDDIMLRGTPIIDKVIPEWFGLTVNDGSDSLTALNKSMTLLNEFEGGILSLPAGEISVSDTFVVNVSSTIIQGQGSAGSYFNHTNYQGTIIKYIGSKTNGEIPIIDLRLAFRGTESELSVDASAGSSTITVNDANAGSLGWRDGYMIGIYLDGTKKQHQTTVNGDPVGNTITLDDPLSSDASVGNLVYRTGLQTKIQVKDLTLDGGDYKAIGLRINYANINCTIENIHSVYCYTGLDLLGTTGSASFNCKIINCAFEHFKDYGVDIFGDGNGIVVKECKFQNTYYNEPNASLRIAGDEDNNMVVVRDNSFGSTNVKYHIEALECDGILIEGNEIEFSGNSTVNGDYALKLGDFNNSRKVLGFSIIGNRFLSNLKGDYAIRLDYVSGGTITGNIMGGFLQNALISNKSSEWVSVIGNETYGRLLSTSLDGLKPLFDEDLGLPEYNLNNVSSDRYLNATGDTLNEVADILGTLINDLAMKGIVKTT